MAILETEILEAKRETCHASERLPKLLWTYFQTQREYCCLRVMRSSPMMYKDEKPLPILEEANIQFVFDQIKITLPRDDLLATWEKVKKAVDILLGVVK